MRRNCFLIMHFFLSVMPCQLYAQWTQISIEGATISVFAGEENEIICNGSEADLYRYSKSESKWTNLNIGKFTGNVGIANVAKENSLMAVGLVSKKGLFISTNNGQTFTLCSFFSTDSFYIQYVSILNSMFFVKVDKDPYFICSKDTGKTWYSITDGIDFPQFSKPNKLYQFDTFIYQTNQSGIFRKGLNENAWASYGLGLPIHNRIVNEILIFNGETICATNGYGLYRLNRILDKWEKYGQNNTDSFINGGFFISNNRFYIGNLNNGVSCSQDSGYTWQRMQIDTFSHKLKGMCFGAGKYWAFTTIGSYFLDTLKNEWVRELNGMHTPNVWDIEITSNKLLAPSISYGLFSVDFPLTNPIKYTQNLRNEGSRKIVIGNKRCYLGSQKGLWFKDNTDNFKDWKLLSNNLAQTGILNLVLVQDTLYFITSGNQFYFLPPSDTIPLLQGNGTGSTAINDIVEIDGNLYIVANNGIFIYDKGFNSWINFDNNLPVKSAYSFKKYNNKKILCRNDGMFVYDDTSYKWLPFGEQLADVPTISMYAYNNVLYISTTMGIYKSDDGGKSFSNISNGLGNLTVRKFLAHQDTLYIASSAGLYYRPISELAATIDEVYPDDNFKLYPNPGSIELNLVFKNTVSQEEITYTIYDIAGKFHKQGYLINNQISTINIQDLSKGLYFICLNVGTIAPQKFMVE